MAQVTDLPPLLAACAALAHNETRAGPEALAALRASLRSIFTILAELTAANPKRSGWTADPKKPGYLVRSLEHGGEALEIHVPLTILDGFPPSEVLAQIAEVALRIRSGDDTAICLSGSTAVYSVLPTVSDIDFCEYVDLPSGTPLGGEDRSFVRTLGVATAIQDDRLLCLRVSLVSPDRPPLQERMEVKRPWSPVHLLDAGLIELARKARAGKCDFIAQSQFQGTIEVTNVVLLIDAGQPDRGSGERSFPFQEAPITSGGGWVPRSLDEPLVLGRYINWLNEEAGKLLIEGKLGKAAKRIYALANSLFRNDIANRMLSLIEKHSQDLGFRGALLARLELRRRLRELSSDRAVAAFEGPLAQTLASLAVKADRLGLPELQNRTDEEAFSPSSCIRRPIRSEESLKGRTFALL